MTVRASGINPEMLRWARERAGYSVEEVSRRRKVSSESVREWEAGRSYPTWRQLEQLAYNDYHRATGFFFLSFPPHEDDVAAEFRRLPSAMLEGLHPETLYAIRQARVRQEDLTLLLGQQGIGESFILRDSHDKIDSRYPVQLAAEVREQLGVGIDEQRSWQSEDEALQKWREQVEDNGIWVFKRSFKQIDIAGFCLGDDIFPVIYLNNGQSKTRQIFTLFHELAHLLFEFNHLERSDTQHYLAGMSGEDRAVEIACNRFAGEFLVPPNDFDSAIAAHNSANLTDEYLASLARDYKVSREVILRKFRDRNRLDSETYREIVQRWRSGQEPRSGSGGNYYSTQATYLGQKYLHTAFRAFDEGRIDEFQLAGCLGVKGSSLDKLEQYAWA